MVSAAAILSFGLFVGPQSSRAAAPPAPASAGKDNATIPSYSDFDKMNKQQVADYIRSGDLAQRQAAATFISERFKKKPLATQMTFMAAWVKPLMDTKMYDEVAELSRAGILSVPHRTAAVSGYAHARVEALLDEKKSDEALAAAKAYYDVCLLKQTQDAMDLLAEALATARPTDSTIVHRMRRQQTAGAQAKDGKIPASLGEPVLASITLDPAPYQQRISELQSGRESFVNLTGLGNLLLLSGQAADAHKVFEQAYKIASSEELVEATQNVARAIRAEDGCVGRANAWIMSLRSETAAKAEAAP
jgi:hypothetical protein